MPNSINLDISGLKSYRPKLIKGTESWVEEARCKQKNSPQESKKAPYGPSKGRGKPKRSDISPDLPQWKRKELTRKFQFVDFDELPSMEAKTLDTIAFYGHEFGAEIIVGEGIAIKIPSNKLRIEGIASRTIQSYLRRLRLREMIQWDTDKKGRGAIKRFFIPMKVYRQTAAGQLKIASGVQL